MQIFVSVFVGNIIIVYEISFRLLVEFLVVRNAIPILPGAVLDNATPCIFLVCSFCVLCAHGNLYSQGFGDYATWLWP